MTKNEKTLLRWELKAIVRQSKSAWLQLKREIFDLGYQDYYDAQGYYLHTAERTVKHLAPEAQAALIAEWNQARPNDKIVPDNFVAAYTLLILEELLNRDFCNFPHFACPCLNCVVA